MPLSKKIILYILGPLFLMSIIVNIVINYHLRFVLEDRASMVLFSEAEAISRAIKIGIADIKGELNIIVIDRYTIDYFMYSGLGLSDLAEDNRWRVETNFFKIARERPRYSTLRLIGLDGKSVIDIIDKKISYKHDNVMKEKWFQNTLKLNKDQILLAYLPKNNEIKEPTILFARLCYDDAGKKQGVISIYCSVAGFFDELSMNLVLSPKGYVYLIDKTGTIIAHNNEMNLGLRLDNFESTKKVVAGNRGTITEIDEDNKNLMKKAYLPLDIGDLGLVVAQPISEIATFSKHIQLVNLIYALMAILLSSLIVYFAVRRFTKPIVALRNVAMEITQGNLAKRAEIGAKDEIGQLAVAFNEMTSKLREKTENLENELGERQKAEEAFKSLVFSAPIGIFIVQEGRFKLTNPGFLEITGYSEKDLLEKDSLDIVVPEFREFVRENAIKTLKGNFLTPYEFQIFRKDGATKWVMETVTSTQYQGSRASLGYFMDITQRKQLETQFLQAQKMEAVGRLAGGVAHDFNNLLTAILSYGELLLLELPENDSGHRYAQEIIKTGERAATLTRQLLAFGRKQIILPKVINLNEVIADMEKMLRRLLGEDINLISLIDPALGEVKADSGQIEQVIMNLGINARDAMPRGGTLTLETENIYLDEAYARHHLEVIPGSYVMLAVSDTGIGMDAATQAHIFEPFFTTKEPGKGTGLGLATVFGIVKQNGGHIWVYSEPGRGATFKIYLPRVEAAAATAHPQEIPTASLRGWETVLVAEDDEALRSVICQTLRGYGYAVLEARHGGEAILVHARHRGPIHLVVTDVVMPGMNGGELVERLAHLGQNMKALFMSGYTEDTAALRGLLSAGVHFLEKPFKPLTLARKVREALDAPQDNASSRPFHANQKG